MNHLKTIPLLPFESFSAPLSMQVRAVFDAMGQHTAHIEYDPMHPPASFTVIAMRGGDGVLPDRAVYLGHVVEVHGAIVTHYYGVPR